MQAQAKGVTLEGDMWILFDFFGVGEVFWAERRSSYTMGDHTRSNATLPCGQAFFKRKEKATTEHENIVQGGGPNSGTAERLFSPQTTISMEQIWKN